MIDEPVQRDLGATASYEPVAASAREVRRLVAQALDGVDATTGQCVQLLASELATNAVLHAGTPFTVKVYATDAVVRVDVTDQGGGLPAIREADSGGGRGLRIVQEVASRWGVRREDDETTVWFELDRPAVPQ